MPDPSPIPDIGSDVTSYLQLLGQADQQTQAFSGSLRTAATAAGPFQRALSMITPSRALLGGMGAAAAGAAALQAQLATMHARATITGASMGQLTSGMQQLARTFPIGNDGARAMVQQLSQLGLATKGAESQVTGLAKVFTKLSGATGEGPAGLAQGFVQLNRVMGTGLDVSRMSKLADSLTTVSAQTGASATGILAFSKAIAPMANAAGIGETKVLGISAAFSKLGEDGYGAANAFNKMLGDLNRSVRDGSPMLNTYAAIVGKTAGQFQALFKSNPTEAITQVFEAVSKGPQGTRALESLGLDGVRTQRYIQELAQSGGLRSAVATSVGAYGSGSTQKAAEAAFGGLADASQKAAANAAQLGEALGTPLLRPLTAFTNALGAATTPFRAAAQSRAGQDVLSTAAYGAIALAVIPRLLKYMGIAQLAGSGPLRSAVGGLRLGMTGGDVEAAQSGLLGRYGGRAIGRIAAEEPLGVGMMGGVNNRFAQLGGTLGTLLRASVPSTGPGLLTQIRNFGAAGATGVLRMYSEQARLARVPFEERETRLLGPRFSEYRDQRESIRAQEAAGVISREQARLQLTQANRDLRGAIGTMGPRAAAFELLRAGGAVAGQTGLTAGAGLLRGGFGLARAGLGALGGVPGLAITAGLGYYQMRQADSAHNKEMLDRVGSTSFLDDYRVAMGKATEATSTFAGKLQATADAMNKGVTTMAQALEISPTVVTAARGGKQTHRYTGSNAGIAAQINAAVARGAAPDEIATMRDDLIRQYGPSRAAEIMSGVRSGTLRGDMTAGIRAQVAGVAGYANDRGPGGILTKDFGWSGWHPTLTSGGPADRAGGLSRLTGGQRSLASDIANEVLDRNLARAGEGGQAFAGAQSRKEIDAAISQAYKSGNPQFAKALQEGFEKAFGGKDYKTFSVSQADIDKAGGFSNVLAKRDRLFQDYLGTNASNAAYQAQVPFEVQRLGKTGLGSLFTAGGGGAAGSLARQLMERPESTALLASAPLTAVNQLGGGTSNSLADLARQAAAAANKLGDTSLASTKFALAVNSMAERMAQVQGTTGTSNSQLALRGKIAASNASIVPTNEATAALQAKGVSDLQDVYVQAIGQVKQRLTAEREYQVSAARAAEDYHRQVLYSEQDFTRQMSRQDEDYHKNVTRQTQDFERTQLRAQRDFNVSMTQATQDYNKSRFRAIRDFNIQLKREIEDSARSIMDPYKRIATQPIWDTSTLVMNLQQQTKAISDQLTNLQTARAAGVSSEAIKLLGLNDPNNAQQLSAIVTNLLNDPTLVQKLNDAAKGRDTVASALVGDVDNTGLQRQKQDLQRGLSDMLNDFQTSVHRARQAFTRTRNDATHDFALTMSRESKDYHTALLRAAQDRTTVMNRMAQQYKTSVTRMHEDLLRADTEISGDLTSLTEAYTRAIEGKFVNLSRLTKNNARGLLGTLEEFSGGWAKYIGALSATTTVTVTTKVPQPLNNPATRDRRMADGGVALNRTNTDIGEESPELVLPLDHRGVRFLNNVMSSLGHQEIRGMPASQAGTVIYDQSTHTYDYSTAVTGPVHVVSQDPEDMLRKLQSKKARSNMTSLRPAGSRG